MTWTTRRVLGYAVVIQFLYMLAVTALVLLDPSVTRTARPDLAASGPSLRDQLLSLSGLFGGVTVGVLLSRFPVGFRWRREGHSAFDALLVGALAATTAAGAYILATFAFLVGRTLLTKGVFAPLIIGVGTLAGIVGFLFVGVLLGAAAGLAGFWGGGLLATAVPASSG
jgi:hypothetical protein